MTRHLQDTILAKKKRNKRGSGSVKISVKGVKILFIEHVWQTIKETHFWKRRKLSRAETLVDVIQAFFMAIDEFEYHEKLENSVFGIRLSRNPMKVRNVKI